MPEACTSARVLSVREGSWSVQTQARGTFLPPSRPAWQCRLRGQLPAESPLFHRWEQTREDRPGPADEHGEQGANPHPVLCLQLGIISKHGQVPTSASGQGRCQPQPRGRPARAHTQRLPAGLRFDHCKSPRFQAGVRGVARGVWPQQGPQGHRCSPCWGEGGACTGTGHLEDGFWATGPLSGLSSFQPPPAPS